MPTARTVNWGPGSYEYRKFPSEFTPPEGSASEEAQPRRLPRIEGFVFFNVAPQRRLNTSLPEVYDEPLSTLDALLEQFGLTATQVRLGATFSPAESEYDLRGALDLCVPRLLAVREALPSAGLPIVSDASFTAIDKIPTTPGESQRLTAGSNYGITVGISPVSGRLESHYVVISIEAGGLSDSRYQKLSAHLNEFLPSPRRF